MENISRLFRTLVTVLTQHENWLDIRHLKTLAWMMAGLIESGIISLTAWAPYVHTAGLNTPRALCADSGAGWTTTASNRLSSFGGAPIRTPYQTPNDHNRLSLTAITVLGLESSSQLDPHGIPVYSGKRRRAG
jgi:hypothetical protein